MPDLDPTLFMTNLDTALLAAVQAIVDQVPLAERESVADQTADSALPIVQTLVGVAMVLESVTPEEYPQAMKSITMFGRLLVLLGYIHGRDLWNPSRRKADDDVRPASSDAIGNRPASDPVV